MKIDYSAYLRVQDDGGIWWRLIDAVKLGSGYLPVRDDDQNLVTTLRAANNRVLADERTLIGEFSQPHYTDTHPRLLEKKEIGSKVVERFVEAQEFLDWLTRYLAASADSSIVFPQDLARAVRNAKLAPVSRAADAPKFESLELALAQWFGHLLVDLPEALRARVEREFFPIPWDDLAESQRRSQARQNDDRNDPALDSERTFWWDFYVRKDALELEISTWLDTPGRTAPELAERTDRLTSLNKQLAAMKRQERSNESRVRLLGRLERAAPLAAIAPTSYVAYPNVQMALAKRLKATPDEIAAWVYLGPKFNGLAAYLNPNELDPPRRFQYGVGVGNERDFDYIAPLMACSFDESEIDDFAPTTRYITGTELLARWRSTLGDHTEAFVIAKIRESRLDDLHPITGGTQATSPSDDSYPPVTSGLFSISEIEAIESEDLRGAGSVHADGQHGLGGSPPPVSAQEIRLNFTVLRDHDANVEWWKDKMSHAKNNGLVGSRVGDAMQGQSGGSMWRPDLVAGWLLDRPSKHRGGMSGKSIRAGLAKFAGYEQAAEDLLIDSD